MGITLKSFTNTIQDRIMNPSEANITKLMTKFGISAGAHYGIRFKKANELFNQGKAREAREYLKAEGKKIKILNKK